MAELVRTNNVGLVNAVEGLLTMAEIPYLVADRNSSVIDGSIQFVQMRVLVPDDREDEARQLLTDGDLGEWLRD